MPAPKDDLLSVEFTCQLDEELDEIDPLPGKDDSNEK